MKRLLVISSVLIYMLCTTGIAARLHFCGGELERISFFGKKDIPCCCGTDKPVKSCCDTKAAYFKVHISHKAAPQTQITYNVFSPAQPALATQHEVPVLAAEISDNLSDTKPPDKEKHPVYLINRVLVI